MHNTNTYYLNEEHELFRQSLRAWLDKHVVSKVDAWEEAGEIPRAIWKQMGEMGFFGLTFPEQYGGMGGDFWYQVIFLEEISKCNSAGFAAAVSAHPILALTHIAESGSDELKQQYLRPGIAGDIFGCLAITEPHAGSDVAGLRTTAVREGDHYILSGSKTFITNGVLSDFLVVAAKTDTRAGAYGISLLVVDREHPGVNAHKLDKLGWHASDTGAIHLDEVRVPVANLIGEPNQGFFYIMQRFALERLVMAISAVAGAEHALEYTLRYMAQRKAFGRPINKFQVLRHRLAQHSAELERARIFNYTIANAFNRGDHRIKECAMAKMMSTELSDQIITDCLQCLGGYGYMEEYPLARMFRDSRLGPIGGGTSEIMREIIAKAVVQ